MTSKDFVREVANCCDFTIADVKSVLSAVESAMKDKIMAGEEFKLLDVSYSVKEMPPRTGFNPLTKERIEIPAKNKIVVKASSKLKKFANGEAADSEDEVE